MESVEEMIVAEIRDNYPFLYNVRDRKYRIREEREKAWAEIGSIVDLDAKSCRTRWRSIRDRYLKERRRQADSPERKKWRLIPMLGFLDDTLEAKMPRTPSVLKKRASLPFDLPSTTTARRIILPALPSTRSASSAGVFPVSLLKAEGPPPAKCRLPPAPQPPPPPSLQTTTPSAITSTTSLLLLPSQSSMTSSSQADATPASTSHGGGGSDSQRKEVDPQGKMPFNPPQTLDEEDYYGLSIAGRLKKLSQRDRALVRIEMEKLFLEYET